MCENCFLQLWYTPPFELKRASQLKSTSIKETLMFMMSTPERLSFLKALCCFKLDRKFKVRLVTSSSSHLFALVFFGELPNSQHFFFLNAPKFLQIVPWFNVKVHFSKKKKKIVIFCSKLDLRYENCSFSKC